MLISSWPSLLLILVNDDPKDEKYANLTIELPALTQIILENFKTLSLPCIRPRCFSFKNLYAHAFSIKNRLLSLIVAHFADPVGLEVRVEANMLIIAHIIINNFTILIIFNSHVKKKQLRSFASAASSQVCPTLATSMRL